MPLPPLPPPPHETFSSTPVKKKQRKLFEVFGVLTEKHKKQDDNVGSETHQKLRKILSSESLSKFEAQLKGLRELEAVVALRRDVKHELRKTSTSTELVDPMVQGRGVAKGSKRSGRPRGSKRPNACPKEVKSHRRGKASPVLRRDPSAYAKLAVIAYCEDLVREQGLTEIKQLQCTSRRHVQDKFRFEFHYILGWAKKKASLLEFVGKNKIVASGLRPCGAAIESHHAPGRHKRKAVGARFSNNADPWQATANKPLAEVYKRVKCWVKMEREHGHEVRTRIFSQRLLFELECERDRQLVLQEHNSKHFKSKTLEFCREKLSFMRVLSPSKRQINYVADVLAKIGSSCNAPRRLSDKQARFDYTKCKMSWQTVDFFIELASKGSSAELAEFVARPDEFQERRESTSFVVMDQTALWLKLRGEERVIACSDELDDHRCLRNLKRKLNGARGSENKQVLDELVEVATNNKSFRDEQVAQYTTAGDKYRLTLVNISGVEGWFNPRVQPRPLKKRGILLVPCSSHCRLEDIGKDGTWLRDWSHKCSDGTEKHYVQGTKVGNLMQGWRNARDNYEGSPSWASEFLVWGQPRAWTDELISCWVVEHIASEWGQSIVQVDCLAAQWSEPVLLEAWLRNVIWCPLAPDTTSYLQEPDTHEHSQLKACLREVKADLHFQLEQESKNKAKEYKDYNPAKWGPYEVLHVAGEGLKRFKQKYVRVPLEGLIRNNMLVIKPTSDGNMEITPDEPPYEHKLPPNRGIPREAAIDRLEICKSCIESKGRPPRPQWELLDRDFHFEPVDLDGQDDEHEDEDDIKLDFAFEALELTEHQKIMLQAPEDRIKNSVYPEFIQRRASMDIRVKKKNKWANKFKHHLTGKSSKTWRSKLAKHGEDNLKDRLARKAKIAFKTVAVAVCKAKAKRKASSKKGEEATKDGDGEKTEEASEPEHEAAVTGEGCKKADEGPDGKVGEETSVEAARQRASRASRHGARTDVVEHALLKKLVRVVGDCANEGRAGEVTAVHKRLATETEPEAIECTIFSTSGTFGELAENLQEVATGGGVEATPFKLDYRRVKVPKRIALKRELEGGSAVANNLELIKTGTTLEQSTVAAICKELELRFECDKANTLIVVPSIATIWGLAEVHEDHGGEVAKFMVKVHETQHVFFVLWSEPPIHYSYLYVKNIAGQPRHIEFKDSLPGEAARTVCTRTLRNLKLIEPHQEAPPLSNKSRQSDGWSCGLWASRWIERQLRENRGEARLVPTSFAEMRTRTNEFISKLTEAKGPRTDGEAASKESKLEGLSKTHEPVHTSFEAALAATWS